MNASFPDKRFALSCCIAAASLATAIASLQAQIVNVQFENANDLNNFTLTTSGALTGGNAPSAAGQLTFGGTSGRNGSGGALHTVGGTTDLSAVFAPTSFDLSTGIVYDISIFFTTGTNLTPSGTGAVVQLGFSGSSTTAYNGDAGNNFITSRINHATH